MADNHTRSTARHTTHSVGGTAVVTLHGEMDVLAVLALRPALDALTAGPESDLVLDLRTVSFIDCSGLGMLCRVRNRIRSRHGRLHLVPPDHAFLRLLRRTGLNGIFELSHPLPGPGPRQRCPRRAGTSAGHAPEGLNGPLLSVSRVRAAQR
ncbi:STAS domain-containing protein [Streptomyces sp. NBC_00631]|uniref:STAS domain-containing protein n=1 Tax=Streptomyces sp. NBC_00631 TaxID=2975793 RepID=UPI0030DFF217